MKNFVRVTLSLFLCVVVLLSAASCTIPNPLDWFESTHPLEEFKNKMDAEENYQIKINYTVPLYGEISMTVKIDGDTCYTPETIFSEEEYVTVQPNGTYLYRKNAYGQWTRTFSKEKPDDDMYGEYLEDPMFNPENYEKVKGEKGVYKQKSDVTFDGFEDVIVTVTEDACTFEMTVSVDGVVMEAEVVISKLGEVELTLPSVK